ncbi:MAG TPA: hypothetical protein V6C76_07895 [Drouetiella sp.]
MNKKVALVALGLSLIGNITMSPSFAVSLSSSKKQTSLQYEVYSKMTTGAGPSTNDLQKQDAQMDTSATASADSTAPIEDPATAPVAANKKADLSPITLDEGEKSADLGPSEEGVLKATVKRSQTALSGPIEQTEQYMKPKSIKAEKALSKDAKDMKAVAKQIGPLALQPTEEEEKNLSDTKFNTEKIELADLWDSTLGRSQDIQFVMNKLMPSNKTGKTSGIMLKALSTAVFGGMSAMTMMAPNYGGQMAISSGASLIAQSLNGMQGANEKRAKLSETESIMLYTIVRNTAEKLVDNFRNYKLELGHLEGTNEDLTKLQDMIKDIRGTQSPADQIKTQRELMEQQRSIEKQTAIVSRYRQALVDIAGTDAVAKLDKQLEADKIKIAESGVIVNQPAAEGDAAQQAAGSGTVPN